MVNPTSSSSDGQGKSVGWKSGDLNLPDNHSWKSVNRQESVLQQEYMNLSSKKDNKASIAAAPVAVDNKGFKTPKEVIAALIIIGEAKLDMKIIKIIVLSFFGGVYTGLGGICATVASSGLPGFDENFPVIPRFISALVWPVGLTFTIVCGAELYMGNCMTCVLAWFHSLSTNRWNNRYHKLLPLNLILVLVMNSLGAVATVYFFGYLTEIFSDEPYHTGVKKIALIKLSYGFGAAFLRGIACSQLICLGIVMAISSEDIISKVISCYISIFTFVFSGYDGSVSNMVLVPLSLMYGSPTTFGKFMWQNFIPSALGNLVGGALCVAVFYYWVYFWKTRKEGDRQSVTVTSTL